MGKKPRRKQGRNQYVGIYFVKRPFDVKKPLKKKEKYFVDDFYYVKATQNGKKMPVQKKDNKDAKHNRLPKIADFTRILAPAAANNHQHYQRYLTVTTANQLGPLPLTCH